MLSLGVILAKLSAADALICDVLTFEDCSLEVNLMHRPTSRFRTSQHPSL